MSSKWVFRATVAAILALAVWIGWRQVRLPERVGDVPYVQTPLEVVDRMLELAGVDPADTVYDLGSGDGRIVIRAAERFGASGRGFELDRLLVLQSRRNAAAAGVADRVRFVEGNLFEADVSSATVVTLYLLPTVNLALRPRLVEQLAPGTPVVSHAFDMGEWFPDAHEILHLERDVRLYLWIVPARVGGIWNIKIDDPADTGGVSSWAADLSLRLMQRFQELEGELVVDSRAIPVTGRVDGESVSIETTREIRGLGTWRLSGTVGSGGIEGALESSDVPSSGPAPFSFTGIRREAALAGVWDVDGNVDALGPRWSFRLGRDGARWVAILLGPDGDERPLDDFYVWGSSISLFVAADDGTPHRIAYHGLVDGDRILGILHDSGKLVPWRAHRRGSRP